MGQKVHPIGFRVGVIRDWDSKWYAEKDYVRFLHEDLAIRRFLKDKLKTAGISRVMNTCGFPLISSTSSCGAPSADKSPCR